jgi:hypothetical protein
MTFTDVERLGELGLSEARSSTLCSRLRLAASLR